MKLSDLITDFNILKPVFKFILIGLSMLLIGVVFHDISKTNSLDTYITKYNHVLAKRTEVLQESDSMKLVVNQHQRTAAVAEEKAKLQQARADSLDKARPKKAVVDALKHQVDSLKFVAQSADSNRINKEIIGKQDTIIQQHEATITNLNQTNTSLKGVIEQDSIVIKEQKTSVSLLRTDNDSLKSVLKKFPKAPSNPDKILGIPMISRTASFFGGTIVGAITVIVAVLATAK